MIVVLLNTDNKVMVQYLQLANIMKYNHAQNCDYKK